MLYKTPMKRIAAGFYTAFEGDYEVFRLESGEWTWVKAGGRMNDVFATKAEAVHALIEWLTTPGNPI